MKNNYKSESIEIQDISPEQSQLITIYLSDRPSNATTFKAVNGFDSKWTYRLSLIMLLAATCTYTFSNHKYLGDYAWFFSTFFYFTCLTYSLFVIAKPEYVRKVMQLECLAIPIITISTIFFHNHEVMQSAVAIILSIGLFNWLYSRAAKEHEKIYQVK